MIDKGEVVSDQTGGYYQYEKFWLLLEGRLPQYIQAWVYVDCGGAYYDRLPAFDRNRDADRV